MVKTPAGDAHYDNLSSCTLCSCSQDWKANPKMCPAEVNPYLFYKGVFPLHAAPEPSEFQQNKREAIESSLLLITHHKLASFVLVKSVCKI